MNTKFSGDTTNVNRSEAGSVRGLAGRKYPIDVARRLNSDPSFVAEVCKILGREPSLFLKAFAGRDIKQNVQSVVGGSTKTKTSLKILWRSGGSTNIRTKNREPSQLHLELTGKFIVGFESQFGTKIPERVKTALQLFTGCHAKQRQILDSVSQDFVGARIRALERKYNDRLTLASMYGYDDKMAVELLEWFRANAANLFLYCASVSEAKDRSGSPELLWFYEDSPKVEDVERLLPCQVCSIGKVYENLRLMPPAMLADMVAPGDAEQVGSTITQPFGTLQYHHHALQFRYDPSKLAKIAAYVPKRSGGKKSHFGSRPKKSGHLNEEMIAKELNDNRAFRAHFCERVGIGASEFVAATAGGKNAAFEDGVLGRKTAGKTDVVVMWKGGYFTNVSIKKSTEGQVYLVTARNFISVYSAQYHATIPENVARALALFIGEAADSKAILEATSLSVDGEKAREQAWRQNFRLMFEVLRAYDPVMADALLRWLKEKIVSVTELCFSAGAVKDRDRWAHVLWYKNLVDVEGQGLDYMVPIKNVLLALEKSPEKNVVERGPLNAGSTIQLPFGHLQYHQKQLEFYQQLVKIQELLAR